MNARQIFEDAEVAINTYKSPDTEELDELLKKMECPGAGDYISYLHVRREWVEYGYEWSSRGCSQSDDYKFPASILDAEDPVKTHKIWKTQQKLAKAESELAYKKSLVTLYEAEVAKIQAELQEVSA